MLWLLLAGIVLFASQRVMECAGVGLGRIAAAQLSRGRAYVSPWGGSFRWLMNPAVQKELEMVDEQVQRVNELRGEIQRKMRDFYQQMKDLPAEERRAKYQEMNARWAEDVEGEVAAILLPEQRDRLRQIDLQMRLRSYYSLGQQLTGEDLADALGLTKRQREKIRKVSEELREEFARKMREF
jgi:phage shock protein A